MASTNGVIFLESMADFLANPVDICFGSMPATSTTPASHLVIEGNMVTTDQQIETNLLKKTHPPTPSDLIAGIDRVEGMLSDTIKVCECVKRPHTTSSPSSMPLGLCNATRVASRYMKRKIQIESGFNSQDRGSYKNHLNEPCPVHEKFKHTARQCHVLKKLRRPLNAHHRRLNQESSSDRLAFQVAHTTISPNFPREEFETPDRQIMVISADVPPQEEKQMGSVKSVKTLTLQEPSDDSKKSPPLPQVQAYSRVTLDKSMPMTQVNANIGQQVLVAPAAPQ
jgi:hypothetical protein